MENFKDKLYHYQAPPPEGAWNKIAAGLDNETDIKIPRLRSKSKFLFYGLTAAASLIIILISTILFNNNKEIKPVAEVPPIETDNLISQEVKDSIELNKQILEKIIQTPPGKKLLASNFEKPKKYLTIAGPEGQPVKISAKAATLILSADDEYPPKPVWNKKIEKWKQIMLSSTTSPTATNLVDILQLAANND